ncbi:hypothetical protein BT96DRAFT_934639, partial [Gymnopus androsaceus JB14]
VKYPQKPKGQAYTLTELREATDYLLSDASTTVKPGNFSTGDRSKVPVSSITASVAPKVESTESKLDQLSQVVASLTQLMTQMVKGGESSPSSSGSGFRPPKPNRSNKCFWDNCDSTRFDSCADLLEWVSKDRVERDENGFVQLKGGQRLPRIQRYMEDHPSEKSWLLESPQVTTGPLAGVDGPSMLAKAASYMASPVDEEQQEAEVIRQLLFKMETRRTAKEAKDKDLPDKLPSIPPAKSKPSPAPNDPEPSRPIPPVPGPTRPPKPMIGKLPPNYVPPQERTVGVPPKDDVCSFRYRAPIETEVAVERVVQAGLSSAVSVRQDDLLAIAPDYRSKVKESVTSRRIGIDGNLLEDIGPTYLLESAKSTQYSDMKSLPFAPKDPPDPVAVFFQEFGDAREGNGFYVAKELTSIRELDELRNGEDALLAVERVEESVASKEMEIDELDIKEALVVVELAKETLIPNRGNLAGNISVAGISFRIRSENIGPVLYPERFSHSFFRVPACRSFNNQVYASILEGPTVPVKDSSPITIYTAGKKCYRPVHCRTAPDSVMLPEKLHVIHQFPTLVPPFIPLLQLVIELFTEIQVQGFTFAGHDVVGALGHVLFLTTYSYQYNYFSSIRHLGDLLYNGVWDLDTGDVLKPEYFRYLPEPMDEEKISSSPVKVEFVQHYWLAHFVFLVPVSVLLTQKQSYSCNLLYSQPPPIPKSSSSSSDGFGLHGCAAFSGHYYNSLTLITRHWNWFNADALGVIRGHYSSPVFAIKIDADADVDSLKLQLQQQGLGNKDYDLSSRLQLQQQGGDEEFDIASAVFRLTVRVMTGEDRVWVHPLGLGNLEDLATEIFVSVVHYACPRSMIEIQRTGGVIKTADMLGFSECGWVERRCPEDDFVNTACAYQVVRLCMTGRKPSPSAKPVSSSSEERTARALRRHSSVTDTPRIPTSTFTPAVEPVNETEGLDDHNSPDPISETPTPNSVIVSLPRSRSNSSHSTSSDDMSPNLSGTGFVDMGSTKTGCQLLVAHPTLEALEEYFDYSTISHDERSITDEAVKKKEFVRGFMKWNNLHKPWIEKHPDQPESSKDYLSRPFFDEIRNHILGSDWARLHDLKRDGFVMLHDARGFSKLCTLMESHNRSLRGTQFHKPDEVLQALIIQKLPEKFRADLVDCEVSEQLPYVEWKKECQGVERRRPPGGPSYASEQKKYPKKVDSQVATRDNQYPPRSHPTHSIPDSHKFPKLSTVQRSLLMSVQGCFRCYTLYAGHIGDQCPTKKPPILSVPYRPLTDADISFAKKCHEHSPNNSIPYELILKQNTNTQTSLRPVAAVQARLPLTEIPDFSQPASAPGSFNIQPHGVHAIYGARPIVHSASGSGVYGNSLDRGFDYDSVSGPVRRPVAAMVPSRSS